MLCYTSPAMSDTDIISVAVDAIVAKGVMRVDAEAYVNKYIKLSIIFCYPTEDMVNLLIDKLMNDINDIHFIYHGKDKAGIEYLTARAAFFAGCTEKEIFELVNTIKENNCTWGEFCENEILAASGVELLPFRVSSKVFKSMVLSACKASV